MKKATSVISDKARAAIVKRRMSRSRGRFRLRSITFRLCAFARTCLTQRRKGAKESSMSEDEVLNRVRAIFESEMDAPSDPGTTSAIS